MAKIPDTQLKLRDAGIQMKLAIKNSLNEDIFRSCINSFISHARSVTFVMQKESIINRELKEWYEDEQKRLKQIPLLKFFNNKRVHSVHRGVVKPLKEQMYIYNGKSSYVNIVGKKPLEKWQFKAKGGNVRCAHGDILTRVNANTVIIWYFDGTKNYILNDSGNVLRLCEEYFIVLKNLVQRWNIKRYELNIK
jgi:hypothetical protein